METHPLLVGLSHHTAPLALRERLAIPPRDLPAALASLRACSGVTEAVILSTCNRVELYVVSDDPVPSVQGLVDFLSHTSRLAPSAFQASLYRMTGAEAIRHLFRVTAGLESMVLGESEITAQVKQAYELAHTAGATGPWLNRLFQKALHSTKLLRSRTRIAEGQASIGSVVVTLARQMVQDRLQQSEVLLWGAGKAAETTARHLIKSGIRQLWVVSRTPAKAQDLASLCQSGWLSWEQALSHLVHVDIAIVCTQAPHYVVDRADLETVLAPRRAARWPHPLLLIDLAVPRNVDPTIRHQPGVLLYNIDDLQSIAQGAVERREQEVATCAAIVQEQVAHLWRGWNRMPRADKDKEGTPCRPIDALSSV
ncbi:MAG: glutamyl-tRNA reductase [Candidatus Omnitrophica bacterium]|nr:glutamyl-tRNA reductase [Candidatus Omnitrophota bacterium]MBI3020930.1 glutamyl-tRNA reductase [Candidatus Omnitrophota bacterium]MBI3084108.1 glutamyl-tRNA reductase [Candidatus Omnitrophota bacterium]